MAHRGRVGMNDFKPQIEPNAGPQPKKRRKNAAATAAAAAAAAAQQAQQAASAPNANIQSPAANQNSAPDLAPPPPISTFGETIVASNPFDDTPPSNMSHHSHHNGMMSQHMNMSFPNKNGVGYHPMNHHPGPGGPFPPQKPNFNRDDKMCYPDQPQPPQQMPGAPPLRPQMGMNPDPSMRNGFPMNAGMDSGYPMNNQQMPPHGPGNVSMPPMMHARNGSHPQMHPGHPHMHPGANMAGSGSPLRSMHQMNNTFGLATHPMDGPQMHNNRGGMPGPGPGADFPRHPGNNPGMPGMNSMNNSGSMSSMSPLGQLAQMGVGNNSHLNMNSPNGSRLSSSPSLAINSPNMGPNGNRLPGSSSPHLGMNSPNLAPNGARLGNSPLSGMNNLNAPPVPMGSPIAANQNAHALKNNGQMSMPLNSPMGNMPMGNMPMGPGPGARMNMANGNPNMMQMQQSQPHHLQQTSQPPQLLHSQHSQHNRNMPISPTTMPPSTMSPLSSLTSLSSMVGVSPNSNSNQFPGSGPPMPMMHHNQQPHRMVPHHQLSHDEPLTPTGNFGANGTISPQNNPPGPPNMNMNMLKNEPGMNQPTNFDNPMMMKNEPPNQPNFDGRPYDGPGPNHPMNSLNAMNSPMSASSQCLPNNMGMMPQNVPNQSMAPCNYNPGVNQKPSEKYSLDGKVYPHDQPYITNTQNPSAPPTYCCGSCHKEINDNEEALFCEYGCKFFYHRVCVGVNEADYQVIVKDVYTEWKCPKCKANQVTMPSSIKIKS